MNSPTSAAPALAAASILPDPPSAPSLGAGATRVGEHTPHVPCPICSGVGVVKKDSGYGYRECDCNGLGRCCAWCDALGVVGVLDDRHGDDLCDSCGSVHDERVLFRSKADARAYYDSRCDLCGEGTIPAGNVGTCVSCAVKAVAEARVL